MANIDNKTSTLVQVKDSRNYGLILRLTFLLFNLCRAFKWVPPQYGHLPLLMNADGTKLSKRQGNINIDHYR